jgi:hypothetical protein
VTEFNVLQMRPMVSRSVAKKVHLKDVRPDELVCSSESTLGNGYVSGVSDLVYVIPENFDRMKTHEIAEEIGKLNQKLQAENRPYLLIGPGRWGSSDPRLGIPVKWNHISNSKLIVETGYDGFSVDPSYGTHFFHNVTSLGIGYFTINEGDKGGNINWGWIKAQKVQDSLSFVRRVRLEAPLDIRIDGTSGKGMVAHN